MEVEELFAVIGFFTLSLSIGLGLALWITRGELWRLLAERRPAAASTDRLERLEQAVEALALEVERISEGQRFMTRLLADRAAPGRLGARASAEQIGPR
jgi:cell division protein FtsB